MRMDVNCKLLPICMFPIPSFMRELSKHDGATRKGNDSRQTRQDDDGRTNRSVPYSIFPQNTTTKTNTNTRIFTRIPSTTNYEFQKASQKTINYEILNFVLALWFSCCWIHWRWKFESVLVKSFSRISFSVVFLLKDANIPFHFQLCSSCTFPLDPRAQLKCLVHTSHVFVLYFQCLFLLLLWAEHGLFKMKWFAITWKLSNNFKMYVSSFSGSGIHTKIYV